MDALIGRSQVIKSVIYVVIFLVTSPIVFASESKVYQSAGEEITGTFQQIKTIKALKRPFVSEGHFSYYQNDRFIWQTVSPISSTKLFTSDGVYNVNEQGEKILEAKVSNSFFFALLSADESKLATLFTVEKLQDCLTLTPKVNDIKTLFTTVDLCLTAEKFPRYIKLNEHSGNYTEIKLNEMPLEQAQ